VLTLVSTALATSLFADMQPNYDNDLLHTARSRRLRCCRPGTGMTAMMGLVLVRGDKHSPLKQGGPPHATTPGTAIIMPICNGTRTVFAGLCANL
jgi:membrane glycosyltransferase